MTPPELPGDAPIADVLVPEPEGLGVPIREEGQTAVPVHGGSVDGRPAPLFFVHGSQGASRESVVGDPDVPLIREVGLDRNVAAVTVSDRMLVVPDRFQKSLRLEPVDDRDSSVLSTHAEERPGLVGHPVAPAELVGDRAVGRHHVDDRKFVPETDVPVVGIMGRRDLEEAGGHRRLGIVDRFGSKPEFFGDLRRQNDVLVLDDGNDPTGDRQSNRSPAEFRGAGILGIHRDRGVTEHRFGTSRRHGHESIAIRERILEVPHVALDIPHLDLVVGQRGTGRRIPIHESLAPIDQSVGEESEERFTNRRGADRIHGESGSIEVARATHLLKLAENRRLVLVLPTLNLMDELVSSEIGSASALAKQTLLDHGLGRDSGMVRPGHPERAIAPHPVVPDQNVLQRVVESVPEVRRRRDIGWRNQHAVGRSVVSTLRGRLGVKVAMLGPGGPNHGLGGGWRVGFGECIGCGR